MSTASPSTSHGLFITFEGIDGTGKSTQMQLLADWLTQNGYDVVITRNPGGTAFGQELRQVLLHTTEPVAPLSELLLFIADRTQHMWDVVIPALQAGKIVLCDRFMDSTLAYQGYGRGLSMPLIESLNTLALQETPPHLTLLFDAPPDSLRVRVHQRGEADRMEREATAFHERVREGFLEIARRHPERIRVFNALDGIHVLQQAVQDTLQPYLTPLQQEPAFIPS